jgi:hypothetical protein
VKGDVVPGPSYLPPNMGESAQRSAIGGRIGKLRDPHLGEPGPGAYEIGREGESARIVIGKRFGREKANENPAPGAYSPVEGHAKNMTAIHVRCEERRREEGPGPSDYEIKRELRGLAVTIHGRVKGKEIEVTPGPSDYKVKVVREGSPSYTIKERHEKVEKVMAVPYRMMKTTVGEGPKISLSGRHRELKGGGKSPDPSYVPPKFGEDGQRSTIGERMEKGVRDSHLGEPGPAHYVINPSFSREAPAFTLKGRVGRDEVNENPSPDKYNPDWVKTRRSSVIPAIRMRPKDGKPEERAGYYELPKLFGGRSYTIKGREELGGMIV